MATEFLSAAPEVPREAAVVPPPEQEMFLPVPVLQSAVRMQQAPPTVPEQLSGAAPVSVRRSEQAGPEHLQMAAPPVPKQTAALLQTEPPHGQARPVRVPPASAEAAPKG